MGKGYKDLIAWRKGMRLALSICAATDRFPRRELFALADQMRRAAVSIPSNIAEGHAHYSPRDFMRFLRHARGSTAELVTQLLIARELRYLDREEANSLIAQAEEISRILSGLIASLDEAAVAAQP